MASLLGSGELARAGVVVRAPLIALAVLLAAVDDSRYPVALFTGVLTAAAVAAALLPQGGATGDTVRYVETTLWGVCVVASGTVESPFLPYLLAPAVVAGLARGLRAAVLVPGVAAATVLAGNSARGGGPPLSEYSVSAAQWVVLAIASALASGWYHNQKRPVTQEGSASAQEAAHQLLVQLRSVARRLPGTLDPASTAETLLFTLREVMPLERGVVLVRSEGQRLVPVALVGADPLDWDLDLSSDTVISEAWASQQPAVRNHQHVRADGRRPHGAALAVPFILGRRNFGVLAVETASAGGYRTIAAQEAAAAASAVALALDTGLLFDEIRSVATVEERQRVAREIHDGIAQELVYIGYALDNVIAESHGRSASAAMQDVRSEIARVIGELRMSLFNLRSALDPAAGLGAALSEHVRTVGARSGLTVHLSLTEGTLRLPPTTEAELLRIAQEAIANARRHSGGTNLWVSCAVNPPAATLVVEDDGTGFTEASQAGSYGLRIMAERAQRLHGSFRVGPRADGTGTRVEVIVGSVRPGARARPSDTTPKATELA